MNENGTDDPGDLRRYAELVERTLCARVPRFVATTESCGAVQVERGLAYPHALCGATPPDADGIGSSLALPFDLQITPRTVVDSQGHRRPVYRGLLFHAVFKALTAAAGQRPAEAPQTQSPETLTPRPNSWIPLLDAQLGSLRWPDHPAGQIPADRGALVVDVVWMSLAAHDAVTVGADAVWKTRAAEAFDRLVSDQAPTGTFLTPSASDNPETHWYHELVLLHAATLYAAETGDRALTAAVARNAAFHQAETQPDHATNQPWGLAAFARDASTRPLADQMLHAAATLGGQSGVTSILLADALYCLRHWTANTA